MLSKPGSAWGGEAGHVSREQLARVLPAPQLGARGRVLVCGPPGFMKSLSGEKKSAAEQGELQGILKDMGYAAGDVFKF